jgi:hypothetical protein
MNLKEERRKAADEALMNFDFEGFVEDVDNWTVDGDVWSCRVYIENEEAYEEEGTTIPLSFTVEFSEGTSEIAWKDCACL